MAKRSPKPNPIPAEINALYRFFGADDALLYIGITINPGSRWRSHSKDKPWWHEVAKVTVEQFDSREAVEVAERAAIQAERPKYNVVHNRHRPLVVHDISAEVEADVVAAIGDDRHVLFKLASYAAALHDIKGESARKALIAKLFLWLDEDRLADVLVDGLFVLADASSLYSSTARPQICSS